MQELQVENAGLKAALAACHQQKGELQGDNQRLRRDNEELRQKYEGLLEEVGGLKATVAEQQMRIQQLGGGSSVGSAGASEEDELAAGMAGAPWQRLGHSTACTGPLLCSKLWQWRSP